MSNEPSTPPTPFQQKALLKMQAMEEETRRLLFERLRSICREEMRGIMTELLSTTSPGQKQMETLLLQLTDEKTMREAIQGELKELNQKLETTPADEAMLTSLRDNARAVKNSTTKIVLGTAAIVILVVAAAFAGLWVLNKKPALVGASQMEEERQLTDRVAKARQLAAEAEDKIVQQKTQLLQLEDQRTALASHLRQLTDTQQTQMKTLAMLNAQIERLQQVQESFRFKLLSGADGEVFIQVPPTAIPFTQDKKTYIRVSP